MSSYATFAQLGCGSDSDEEDTPKEKVIENFDTCSKKECNMECKYTMNPEKCNNHCIKHGTCKKEYYTEKECEDIREKCRVECWTNPGEGQWPCQVECMKDTGCPMD